MSQEPDRHHPHRLADEAYDTPHCVVFITICAKSGRAILCTEDCAPIIIDCIRQGCEIHSLDLIAYCVMPDHVHIVVMTRQGSDFLNYLKGFKWATSRRMHQAGIVGKVWQRSYWDRHHRDDDDVTTMIEYVMNNPVRKEPCRRPEDWTHSQYLGLSL
jgi:putative transposase